MMDDPFTLSQEDYRELAAFLEQQLPLCQTQGEADELRWRLARIYLGTLQDPTRAAVHGEGLLQGIEPLVAKDPGDDVLRARFISIAKSCGAELAAADALGRALKKAKGSGVRERVGFDVASLYLHEGELKQARGAFLEVVLGDAAGPCALAAAHRLVDLEGEPGDPQVIGAALEMIAKAAPDLPVRQQAATQLLSMHESRPLKESRLAVVFQALVDSPRADEALAWLRTFHERRGDKIKLSEVYRRQALRAGDPDTARSLALRSVELCSGEPDTDRIERWLWFIQGFGPHRAAHAELLALLEPAQRWQELATVLEAEVELALPEEHAALWARLGQTRLEHLGDTDGALSAIGRCLTCDTSNAVARGVVEGLMATGDRRLAAADILDPVYRVEKVHAGQLRVLETRAELLPDPRSRLASLTEAVAIASDQLAELQHSMRLCGRALGEALAFATDAVLDWLAVLQRVAGLAKDREGQARILLDLLGDGPIDSFERVAIAVSAIEALMAANAPDRALALCQRAIASDPSSPELLRRLDELLREREDDDARLARYQAALEATTVPARRSSLMHAIAVIRSDSSGDPAGALEAWRAILTEDPTDFEAHEALISATEKVGDIVAASDLIDRARKALRGHRRNLMTLRKVRALLRQGATDQALDLCREIIAEQSLAATATVDQPAARAADVPSSGFDHAAAGAADVPSSGFDHAAAGAADVPSIQAVAEIAGDQADVGLCRRALDLLIAVGDRNVKREALERLGDLLFAGDRDVAVAAWRAAAQMYDESPAERDRARTLLERVLEAMPLDGQAAAQLLELYAAAADWAKIPAALGIVIRTSNDLDGCAALLLRLEQSAIGARAVDRFAALVDELAVRVGTELPERIPALKRSKARALRSDSTRQREASQALRELIETSEDENDVRDFESFVESRAEAGERHQDRRWLYQWRASHSARPADVLMEWARAEEEYGEPRAAMAVCQRIEQVANAADDLSALRILDSMLAGGLCVAPQESGARHRWLRRIIELSPADPWSALSAAVRGATDSPDAIWIWEGAERIARDLGSPEVVVQTYYSALVDRVADPALAEVLGRRMIAFEEQCAIESSRSIDALHRVLALAPGARWALDRVKLELGSQARYPELFALYDRAIEAAADERQRGELLYEAAFAARDLAGQPEQAIRYFEALQVLRRDDDAVDAALERLYERQERKVDLIKLLDGRLDRATGFKRRDLRRRTAFLWLDLGDIAQAGAVIETMFSEDDAFVADVVDLLERVLETALPPSHHGRRRKAQPADIVQRRATQLLRGHYESVDRMGDVLRVVEKSLSFMKRGDNLADCIRDLVRLRLRVAEPGGEPFAQVIGRIESDTHGDPRLRMIAHKALLLAAIRAHRRGPISVQADAERAAWRSIQELKALLIESGRAEVALRLVYRCSRLPVQRNHRRELLSAAASLCADRLEDAERAIRIFVELYEDNAGDDIAARSLLRFAELLDRAGQHARLARLWEEQARIRATVGDYAEEAAFWQRAAVLWERQGDSEQAIGAYRRGAALGADASFEALARIHADSGQWADAAKAGEWLNAHSPTNVRAARALHLANAYEKLGKRDRSRACLEDALHAVEADVDRSSLVSSAAVQSTLDEVRERLIALYRQDEIWRPLARLLSSEARRVEDPGRKLALLREASDLHRARLDEPAEAAALLEPAVALDPRDVGLRDELADVLETLERWDQAALVLRARIDLQADQRSKERAALHRRLAHALGRAKRSSEALAELRLAVELHPTDPASLYDLARTAMDVGQLELSEATYRALLLASHRPTEDAEGAPPLRADVFADLSEIASRNGDTARAIDFVDSAIEEVVQHGEDPRHLERRLRERGRYGLLARALERRVERGGTLTDRAVALGDLSDLWSEHLDRSSELGGRLRQQAERIARDLDHEDLMDPSGWTALSTALARFSDAEGASRLVLLLEAAIPKLDPGADRSRLRVLRARTLLGQSSPPSGVLLEAAVAELSNAIAEHPAGSEAAHLLSDVLERQGRVDELVTALRGRLQRLSGVTPVDTSHGEPTAQALVEAAWHLGRALERAGRSGDALPVYESILDQQPADRETVSALADRLDALGSDRVAECLDRWIAVDVAVPVGTVKRLVELRDGQGDAPGAIRALEAGLSAHPEVTEFRDRLVERYEESAEWGQVVRVLGRAVDAAPHDRPLFLRLIDAYRRVGSHEEALRALDAEVSAHSSPPAVVDPTLLAVRAQVREAAGDPEGALSDLESASMADSAYVNPLIDLFARTSIIAGSPADDAHAVRLVDTLIRVNRPKQARRELERLLARSPNHLEGLDRLASLAAAEGNWNAAAQTYQRLLLVVEKGSSRERLARVAIATADACQRAGGLGEARVSLIRVLDSLSQGAGLLQELEQLCQAMKEWGRLASLLVSRAEHAEHQEGAAEKVDLLMRAAHLFLHEAGDPASALRVLAEVGTTQPQSVERLLLWSRAQVAMGQAPQALAVLHDELERHRSSRSPMLANIYLEIGKAHLAVDEIVEGFDALEAAFSVDWRCGDVAMLLGLAALDLEKFRIAERALSAVTTLPPRRELSGPGADAATKAVAFYHLASMAWDRGDLAKARRLATKAVGGNPSHIAARDLLEKLESRIGAGGAPGK